VFGDTSIPSGAKARTFQNIDLFRGSLVNHWKLSKAGNETRSLTAQSRTLQVRGHPPFRQQKGERMGHGEWYSSNRSET
jgi:hypothetical protein